MRIARRTDHDREIVRLALPALGALAAEPLYILADTAIVGHLGTHPLAGLAIAGTLLTSAFTLFNFLAYATTGAVARQVGARNPRIAVEQGIDGIWLAALLGCLLLALGLGIAGSAWGTVAAQYVAALAYLVFLVHVARPHHAAWRARAQGMRESARLGGRLVVRTGSLLVAFLVTTAVASRLGDAQLGAHQVAFQVMMFLALSMDALAIAGQALVGKFLGGNDADEARAAARRMIEWGVAMGIVFAGGLLALRPWIAPLFTNDARVTHLTLQLLLVVAALQPLNAVVFVLDGILIGAGDVGYLAVAMAVSTFVCFLPVAVTVHVLHGTLVELWGALCVLMLARFVTMWWRYRTPAWLVTGAIRA